MARFTQKGVVMSPVDICCLSPLVTGSCYIGNVHFNKLLPVKSAKPRLRCENVNISPVVKPFPLCSFSFSSMSNDCQGSTLPGCSILGLMNRRGKQTAMEIDFFSLSLKRCLIIPMRGASSRVAETQHQTMWIVQHQGHRAVRVLRGIDSRGVCRLD